MAITPTAIVCCMIMTAGVVVLPTALGVCEKAPVSPSGAFWVGECSGIDGDCTGVTHYAAGEPDAEYSCYGVHQGGAPGSNACIGEYISWFDPANCVGWECNAGPDLMDCANIQWLP